MAFFGSHEPGSGEASRVTGGAVKPESYRYNGHPVAVGRWGWYQWTALNERVPEQQKSRAEQQMVAVGERQTALRVAQKRKIF